MNQQSAALEVKLKQMITQAQNPRSQNPGQYQTQYITQKLISLAQPFRSAIKNKGTIDYKEPVSGGGVDSVFLELLRLDDLEKKSLRTEIWKAGNV